VTRLPVRRASLALVVSVGIVTGTISTEVLDAQAAAWDVKNGDVRVQCPLTIGGSFEAKTRMFSGAVRAGATPAEPLSGELVVELGALDTGIGLRNQHLRDNYLEVGRGPEFARAVLKEIRLKGLDPMAGGKGTFTGTLRLHGVEKAVSGQAEIRRSGTGLRIRASFPVVLRDFGIAEPRYLGVGVKDEVTVQVSFETTTAESTR